MAINRDKATNLTIYLPIRERDDVKRVAKEYNHTLREVLMLGMKGIAEYGHTKTATEQAK